MAENLRTSKDSCPLPEGTRAGIPLSPLAPYIIKKEVAIASMLKAFGIGLIATIALLTISPETQWPPTCPPSEVQPLVSLPKDEAPHSSFMEWWYYTGHLKDERNDHFGFELVFFQVRLNDNVYFYLAHFAITDESARRFVFADRQEIRSRQSSDMGFDLRVGEWRMSGMGGRDRLEADMGSYAIQLDLVDMKGPVFHNHTGYIGMTTGAGSYYYSRTRMEARGFLAKNNQKRAVHGIAWMDHQWGDFDPLVVGWDWFSLRLDPDIELMLFDIWDRRSRDKLYAHGSLVDGKGRLCVLHEGDFEIVAKGRWESPHTGAVYPMPWEIRVPSFRLLLDVQPVLQDQEIYGAGPQRYWEGSSRVQGRAGELPVEGRAYVELVGY
ncbi:MAG: hypothetical protein NZ930_05380 [Candidatus Bipolaricaulota bacterium]|nr:hypothetical protein [Candidatus Bipolaricaulota bacterium]MDW8031001.1 lipocalin-like domain-containing protein [Candidatus Bipolaricaulota bacterium]